MPTQIEKLNAKVAARNGVNRLIKTMAPQMFACLSQFVGKKVCLATGGFIKAVRDGFPSSPHTGTPRWILTEGHGYNLRCEFRTCESTPDGHAYYAEASLYLADLQRGTGIIEKMYEFDETQQKHFRTDWTADEVMAARKDLDAAKKALSAAQSRLGEFGEYDQ